MITRSSNLRRLSFVLLAAEQNHYLAQLPAIQEKLVDILRTNVVSPRVHSEVGREGSECANVADDRSISVCESSCAASAPNI